MAKSKTKPAAATVEAERLHLVYFDAQEDRLKCVVGDAVEDLAVKIAELAVDCPHVIVKGTRIDSTPRENVAVLAIGGIDYKVTKNQTGTEVAIAEPPAEEPAKSD